MNIKLTFDKDFEIKADADAKEFLLLYYQNTVSDSEFLDSDNFDEFIKDTMGTDEAKSKARKALEGINEKVLEAKQSGYVIDEEGDSFNFIDEF